MSMAEELDVEVIEGGTVNDGDESLAAWVETTPEVAKGTRLVTEGPLRLGLCIAAIMVSWLTVLVSDNGKGESV
jgi:hypothetical protein